MNSRLKGLGVVLVIIGIAFVAGGGFAFMKTQEGAKSLQAFSAAQNVTLTYNEAGQLVDGGKVEEAQGIMSLLTNDWGFPVVASDLTPNDPVVNTASEYMYQMATISYHTLHGTQTVVLDADVTAANGQVYKAGTYEFPIAGRYWSAFDRSNPIEAAARAQAWTGVAHGLIAELGVGTVTASTLQMGLGLAALFGALGGTFVLMGLGLVWATRPETVKVPALRPVLNPA
ncbi:MAG: hypothetical protein ABJC39_06910 [Chloroflexota bacterium]